MTKKSERVEFFLSDLLAAMDQALAGDTVLRDRLFSFLTDMANNTAESKENRAIGRVFAAILKGERRPDLTGLPPESAMLASAMVANLRNKEA
jgi:hypothetical protein